MTRRLVIILGVLAAVSVVIAGLVWRSTHVFVVEEGVGEPVLAGLADEANNVARIEISKGTEKLVLIRDGDVWKLEKSGYPASGEQVRKAIVGLIEMVKMEAKTSNPSKYLLIDVDKPGEADSRGRLVVLKDAAGKLVGQIILGKVAIGKAGPGKDAQYVRLPGDATSWLVKGAVMQSVAVSDWVKTRFLKINVDSVSQARIEHADGEVIEVRRTGKSGSGSSVFELLNVPEGRKPLSSTFIKFAATDLANLDMIDVRPAKAGAKPLVSSSFSVDGGMKISVKMFDGGWVQVAVVDKGSDTAVADAISARVDGWQFLVSKDKQGQILRRMDQLLEKK